MASWQPTGGTAVHSVSTPERSKSAAPTVRVTNPVSWFNSDGSVLITSDVDAPVHAALAKIDPPFGVEQIWVAVRALQARFDFIAPALSGGIGIAQRNVLDGAGIIGGSR